MARVGGVASSIVRSGSALLLLAPLLALAQRTAPPSVPRGTPSVSAVTPNALEPGRTYELTLVGTGFAPGVRFAFGPGVEPIGAAQVLDDKRATQRVRVAPGAGPGPSFVAVRVGRELVRSAAPLNLSARPPSAARAAPSPSESAWFRRAPRVAAQRDIATAPLRYTGPAPHAGTIQTAELRYIGATAESHVIETAELRYAGPGKKTLTTGSLEYVGPPHVEKTVIVPPLHYLGGSK